LATSATKRDTSKKLANQLGAATAEIQAAIAHRVQAEEAVIELLCPCCRLYGALGADPDEVKRVRKFVCQFHSPILARLRLAIEALQLLTRSHGCFFPCRMPVGQFFSDRILLGLLAENVKEVPRHISLSRATMSGSEHGCEVCAKSRRWVETSVSLSVTSDPFNSPPVAPIGPPMPRDVNTTAASMMVLMIGFAGIDCSASLTRQVLRDVEKAGRKINPVPLASA
jgi:hypothetical protein